MKCVDINKNSFNSNEKHLFFIRIKRKIIYITKIDPLSEFIYFFFRAFFTVSTLDVFSLVTIIFGMLLAFAFFRLSRFFRLFSSCFQIINFWLHSLFYPRDIHSIPFHGREKREKEKRENETQIVHSLKTNHMYRERERKTSTIQKSANKNRPANTRPNRPNTYICIYTLLHQIHSLQILTRIILHLDLI